MTIDKTIEAILEKKCRVPDCYRGGKISRGLCKRHYTRLMEKGDETWTRPLEHPSEYKNYRSAQSRCTKPSNNSYPNYGGRGVEFRFQSFDEFFKAVGPKPTPEHTIDRINPYGHYEKGNVRWATRLEQRQNRRSQ